MNNYKELKIWQKGMDVVQKTYIIAQLLPEDEKYNLKSQMIRSAVSIPSNIAEGTSRKSNKDFARFLEISLGSCFELETQLLITQTNILIKNKDIPLLLDTLEEIQKMINSFIRKLVPKQVLETSN